MFRRSVLHARAAGRRARSPARRRRSARYTARLFAGTVTLDKCELREELNKGYKTVTYAKVLFRKKKKSGYFEMHHITQRDVLKFLRSK